MDQNHQLNLPPNLNTHNNDQLSNVGTTVSTEAMSGQLSTAATHNSSYHVNDGGGYREGSGEVEGGMS